MSQPLFPSQITSTMGQWENYAPGFAFDGDLATYYWSNRCPLGGDSFRVSFNPVLPAGRWHLKITTGKPMDPEHDRLLHAKVFFETAQEKIELGSLVNGAFTCGAKTNDPLHALSIQVTGSQNEWVVIQNIFLAKCK